MMMMRLSLFFVSLSTWSLLSCTSSFSESPFTFYTFENSLLSLQLFEKERLCIRSLVDLRQAIQLHKSELKSVKFLREMKKSRDQTKQICSQISVNHRDLQGALRGLVYLHDTYHLNVRDLTKGFLTWNNTLSKGRVRCEHSLSWSDLLQLTKQAFAFKWYDCSMDFLKTTWHVLKQSNIEVDKSTLKHMAKMQSDLITLNNQHLHKNLNSIGKDYKVYPYLVGPNMRRLRSSDNNRVVVRRMSSSKMGKESRMREVCRGDEVERRHQHLLCHFLSHEDNIFLRLAPFKVEQRSLRPFVMEVHDFLTDKEISFIIEEAKPNLSKERLRDPYNEALVAGLESNGNFSSRKSNKRVKIVHKSVQTWLRDVDYDNSSLYSVISPTLLRISLRIEHLTKLRLLSPLSSSEYQVTHYGLGGLCESHLDPHGYIEGQELPPHPGFQRLRLQGDMLATLMVWLNSNENGGTAFSHHNHELLLGAKKGNAAFWIDLDRKGFRDHTLLHGGCPVLMGDKWILNKWIHYFDQSQKFPCGLQPNDTFGAFRV